MLEPGTTEAVATPTSAETPTTPAPSMAKGLEARRAAALEVAISDPSETSEDDGEEGEGEEVEASGETQPVKAEEPKKETPPDPLQARAQADRYLQGERKRLDEERSALAKERSEWEASREEAPDAGAEVGKVHRLIGADIVEYADQQKWTAKQRYDMAQALGWSSQPEDKRPAGWRGNGQGQVMSVVEQLRAELGKTRAEVDGWKKSHEDARKQSEEDMRSDAIGAEVLKAPVEGMKYAKGFAEHNPQIARRELATLAKELIDAEHKTAEREYREPKQVTAADVLGEYDKRWQKVLEQQFGWAFKLATPTTPAVPAKTPAKAPQVPSATSMASPSQARVGKMSREERRRAALEALPED